MKKLFTMAICLTLFFTACDLFVSDDLLGNEARTPAATLTIRNESSFDLSGIGFSGISFGDLSVSAHATRTLGTDNINTTGRITFTRSDIGIVLRTDVISVGEQGFTFTDHTIVEELANTSNRRPLGQISFLSQLTVERGSLPVARNENINLGDSVVNTSRPNVFTIRNTGVGSLLFDTAEPVQISNDPHNVFTVVQPASAEVASSSSLPFTINFTPRTFQPYTATVTIRSNDESGDYVFTISAAGVAPKPIASVIFDGTEIAQNGTIDAGEVLITLSQTIVIAIRNDGTQVLEIDPANIIMTGTDAAAYTIVSRPSGTISIGGQSLFMIETSPVRAGGNYATLIIPTNDSDRNPIMVILRTTGVQGFPVVELRQDNTIIANNSLTPFDFGQTIVGQTTSLVFAIRNTGNIPLVLNGNPIIESSNAVFYIPNQPANTVINPGADISFIMRYAPTSEGVDTAAITFLNNSAAMQFSFPVRGTGHVPRPQITLHQGAVPITPHGGFDFGTVATGESGSIAFTIGNSGEANLSAVGTSWVNITGPDADLFTVTLPPPSALQVAPGGTTTFTVRYAPTAVGTNFNATVQISTNSRDKEVFSFTVRGNGRERRAQMTITQDDVAVGQYGEFDFGSVEPGGSRDVTFTIENTGDANMTFVNVGGNRINIFDDADGGFSVIQQPSAAMVIAPGNTVTFTLRFSPTTEGFNYIANVQIETNSEHPIFSFWIRGRCERRIFQIGDTGPGGGIVFFDAGAVIDGWRFLEAAPITQSAQWGGSSWTVGGTGRSIGSGRQNTQLIVAHHNSRGFTGTAAQLAAGLDINGFNDWFLPSRDELLQMKGHRTILGMQNSSYWSSSESGSASAVSSMGTGTGSTTFGKGTILRVRAIRAF